MIMHISKPTIIAYEDKSRLISEIRFDKENEYKVEELWLEVDHQYASYLCDERSDAFLVGMLQYAMRFGYDISCVAPVTKELLYNLENDLIPILCKTSSKKWHRPKITATTALESLENAGGVGTGMSCGIDSFHATLSHLSDVDYKPKLTHLFINDIGSFQVNYNKDASLVKEEIFARAKKVAKSLNLPLVESNTNIYQIYGIFGKIHTYSTAFTVLALQKLWKIYLFAGAGDYSSFSLFHHDKIDCAWYDLLSLNCFSTSNLRFYSEGGAQTRGEKTIDIADHPLVQKELHVCFKGIEHCGKCKKCQRTMLMLDGIGKLEAFDKIFPVEYYKENIDDYLTGLADNYVKKDVFAIETYDMFLKNEKYIEKLKSIIQVTKPNIQYFIDEMNQKTDIIGMKSTMFTNVHGLSDSKQMITAKDVLQMMVSASQYPIIQKIWGKGKCTIHVRGENKRKINIKSTWTSKLNTGLDEDWISYHILGGKTGTVKSTDPKDTKKRINNFVCIAKRVDSDLTMVGTVLNAKSRQERFDIIKCVIKASFNEKKMIENENDAAYAVATFQQKGRAQIIDDLLMANKEDQRYPPASLTKIMTSMVLLDFITDVDEEFSILESDIMRGSGSKLYPGDIITFRDALYLGLLESSNSAMEAVARVIGGRMKRSKNNNKQQLGKSATDGSKKSLIELKKEIKFLEKRIRTMRNSTSWRLTKPFRKASKMLK